MELDKFFGNEMFPTIFIVLIGTFIAFLIVLIKRSIGSFPKTDDKRSKKVDVFLTVSTIIMGFVTSYLFFELDLRNTRYETCLSATLELRRDIGNFQSLPVESGLYRDVIDVQSDPNNIGYSVGREYRVKLQNSLEGWIFSCRNLTKAIDDKPRLWHSIPLQNTGSSWTVSNVNDLLQLTTDVLGELL